MKFLLLTGVMAFSVLTKADCPLKVNPAKLKNNSYVFETYDFNPNAEEYYTHEYFKDLIEENNPYILAVVITTPKAKRDNRDNLCIQYHFFDANKLNSLSANINPINNYPIQNIVYFKCTRKGTSYDFECVDSPYQKSWFSLIG